VNSIEQEMAELMRLFAGLVRAAEQTGDMHALALCDQIRRLADRLNVLLTSHQRAQN
jgi:hypothetical protein